LGKLAAQATRFAARNAASHYIRNVVADANDIAATSAVMKPAGRGISRLQLLPAGVAKQSHDQLKIGL